ncbi:glycosyltransferase family 4 protein [Spirosoma utsteinense]|uniref:Glycosyltransferase involved in cell wall biosynthesis n=1 Tax=Spirosoma utsteinense TaxID=2585773 RepID=A0ABR6WAD6_9BACT|nr:glycosyltransferase family 1 protein [Spirosoma utsteinense]MBC3787638.1 glycosyltransferase involved in cell wall biosynthesis [Spirosoma utsteinense]MBC3793234.1 glycosyltransferase involved in cell wall biosynthesis [Spirosoma utsteinense]
MPSLFIDAERLRDLNSGLGQVCLHLGHELVRQCPQDRDGEPWKLTFLVPKGQTGVFGNAVTYVEASWQRKLWIQGTYDVWHCLHQDSSYLPGPVWNKSAKLMLTIYDLNFLERVDYSAAKKGRKLARLQRKIDQASLLTAGSAYTASVVREHLHIPESVPFPVVYTGVAVDPKKAPASLPADSALDSFTRSPFLFFVGVIHPKKNVHTLLPLLEAFPDYRLVLAGPDGHPYAQHIREQAEKLGIADRLFMAGSVDEATKLWLYDHCEAFLFPSLSEGFGLPVVEAMAFGKPVFISTLTSLPEVGGKEAYYFENFEPEHMAKVLHDGLHDFGQNELRQDRMKKRAAGFSWPDIAGEYWTLYKRLAGVL